MSDFKDTEWWWIDYLEDELDPALDKDLELLLDHSQRDRDSFENFRLLKQWVRESDPVATWPLDDRLRRMRSNVMAVVEAESVGRESIDYRPPVEETNALSV
jgi:hypothetical protein